MHAFNIVVVVVASMTVLVLGVWLLLWRLDSGTPVQKLSPLDVYTRPGALARQGFQSLPSILTPYVTNPAETLTSNVVTQARGPVTTFDVTDDAPPVNGDSVKSFHLNVLWSAECYARLADGTFDYSACPPSIQAVLEQAALLGEPSDLHVYPADASAAVAGRRYPWWWSPRSLTGMLHRAQASSNAPYDSVEDATSVGTYRLEPTLYFNGSSIPDGTVTRGHTYFFRGPPGLYNRYRKGDDKVHYLFHQAAGQTKFACLPVLKVTNYSDDTRHTGGSQMYASVNPSTGDARVVALNAVVSYTKSTETDSQGFRDVLLLNTVTRRFLYKSGAPDSRCVVAGYGGYNFSIEQWRTGVYYAQVYSETLELLWQAEVDASRSMVTGADASPASIVDASIRGWFHTPSADGAARFLGLDFTETTDLGPWLDMFATASPLSTDQIPRGQSSVTLGGQGDAFNLPDTVVVETVA
jgi:hypothetical protein